MQDISCDTLEFREGHTNYRRDLVIWLVHLIYSAVGFALCYNYVKLNYCIRFVVVTCVRLRLNSCSTIRNRCNCTYFIVAQLVASKLIIATPHSRQNGVIDRVGWLDIIESKEICRKEGRQCNASASSADKSTTAGRPRPENFIV